VRQATEQGIRRPRQGRQCGWEDGLHGHIGRGGALAQGRPGAAAARVGAAVRPDEEKQQSSGPKQEQSRRRARGGSHQAWRHQLLDGGPQTLHLRVVLGAAARCAAPPEAPLGGSWPHPSRRPNKKSLSAPLPVCSSVDYQTLFLCNLALGCAPHLYGWRQMQRPSCGHPNKARISRAPCLLLPS